jgi:hypothetical protein
MFEIQYSVKGNKVLVWVDRSRVAGESGTWVEIGHEEHKDIEYHVEMNRSLGYEVEIDEKGYYRALVLRKD